MAGHKSIEHLESPVLTSASENSSMEWLLMFVTLGIVVLAIFLAYRIYRKSPQTADKLSQSFSGVHKVLLNKYYIDELYGALIVRPTVYFSVFLWKIMDVLFIDGLINALAKLYEGISENLRTYQTGRIRTYATVFALGVVVLIAYMVLA
jgi:NADH-quinone oxidoreductase subunit L